MTLFVLKYVGGFSYVTRGVKITPTYVMTSRPMSEPTLRTKQDEGSASLCVPSHHSAFQRTPELVHALHTTNKKHWLWYHGDGQNSMRARGRAQSG